MYKCEKRFSFAYGGKLLHDDLFVFGLAAGTSLRSQSRRQESHEHFCQIAITVARWEGDLNARVTRVEVAEAQSVKGCRQKRLIVEQW